MTTTMTTSTATPRRGDATGRAFAAEWIKLRTLRSTWVTIVGSGLVSVFLAAVVAATQVNEWDDMSAAQRADFDPVSTPLVGVLFTTVIVGALGNRSITSEHSTGMI